MQDAFLAITEKDFKTVGSMRAELSHLTGDNSTGGGLSNASGNGHTTCRNMHRVCGFAAVLVPESIRTCGLS